MGERLRRFDEALENYRKASAVLESTVGAKHPWTEQAQVHIDRCELTRRRERIGIRCAMQSRYVPQAFNPPLLVASFARVSSHRFFACYLVNVFQQRKTLPS